MFLMYLPVACAFVSCAIINLLSLITYNEACMIYQLTVFTHTKIYKRVVLLLYFPSLEQAAVHLLKRNSTPISRRNP